MPALVYPHPAAAPVLRPLVGMVKLLLFQQHHVVTSMGAESPAWQCWAVPSPAVDPSPAAEMVKAMAWLGVCNVLSSCWGGRLLSVEDVVPVGSLAAEKMYINIKISRLCAPRRWQ